MSSIRRTSAQLAPWTVILITEFKISHHIARYFVDVDPFLSSGVQIGDPLQNIKFSRFSKDDNECFFTLTIDSDLYLTRLHPQGMGGPKCLLQSF